MLGVPVIAGLVEIGCPCETRLTVNADLIVIFQGKEG